MTGVIRNSEKLVFDQPVTLVGAGALRRSTLKLALSVAPMAVAVDGGANCLRAWSADAAAVLGDFDSIEMLAYWKERGTPVFHISEQDTTDLEKCMEFVSAPAYVLAGFLGSRLDHSLSAFGIIADRTDANLILLGGADLAFAPPLRWSAKLVSGSRLSMHATRPVRIVEGRGLHWPPEGLTLEPGSTRGIANRVTGSEVQLAFDRNGVIIVTERSGLPAIMRSMLPASGT